MRNENLIFLFLRQNICCGYSKVSVAKDTGLKLALSDTPKTLTTRPKLYIIFLWLMLSEKFSLIRFNTHLQIKPFFLQSIFAFLFVSFSFSSILNKSENATLQLSIICEKVLDKKN